MSITSPPIEVSVLTDSIKNLLEKNFLRVVVKGELSNVSLQTSGHLYFAIKDSKAVLNGAFFHFRSKYFDRKPKDGDYVILHGKLTVYAPRGQYQIVAYALTFSGEGNLLQQFEERKQRLAAEGYFDPKRKKPLPSGARVIGVITSPTGAVIQDILRVLSRRCHQFQVILYPVTVQGATAAQEISQAIQFFNQNSMGVHALIIARGGGSIEDLWAFNEEELVKSIVASSIPIISAVGHETDFTLCDFASDVRAPTPSAAAEIVCKSSDQYRQELQNLRRYVSSHARQFIAAKKNLLTHWQRHLASVDFYHTAQQTLDYIRSALERGIETKLEYYKQRFAQYRRWLKSDVLIRIEKHLADLNQSLMLSIKNKIYTKKTSLNQLYTSCLKNELLNLQHRTQHSRNILSQLSRRLHIAIASSQQTHQECLVRLQNELSFTIQHLLTKAKERCQAIQEQASSLNPKNVLKRGFAQLFDFNKHFVIISAESLKQSDLVRVCLQDGEAVVSVKEVWLNNDKKG
ncbi:exodeoxyribonuclease VII large subunit [Chlamydia trachomatis D/SotonD1]|uniref:exodeoxyribonuclease VII large subunit n=1 Tax=Chlamydia trachomatis TaxID=813 RepID=UPI0002A8099A|nr:exodeoxyribonuclease VII large subunit [Chlamydia trachomatis]CCP52513.1 exodeoxyribonuclease VII large subunit [Chlamydia trachomatis D/SotonD1]